MKKLMAATLAALILLGPLATATERTDKPKVTCKDVITACDKAIAAKNKTIKLSATTIDTLKKQNGDLTVEVNDLRDSGSKWYHNPIVVFVLGAAAGSLAYTFLKK